MEGDLHRLKKVCLYASKVMRVGEVVLAAIIVLTLGMGVGSLVSDGVADFLESWVDWLGAGSSEWIAILEFVLILALGLVTVHIIKVLMVTIQSDYTPFTKENEALLRNVCFTYLGAAVVLPVIDYIANGSVSSAVFLMLGTLLISVVMYCLSLVFRYGAVLQKESDETL